MNKRERTEGEIIAGEKVKDILLKSVLDIESVEIWDKTVAYHVIDSWSQALNNVLSPNKWLSWNKSEQFLWMTDAIDQKFRPLMAIIEDHDVVKMRDRERNVVIGGIQEAIRFAQANEINDLDEFLKELSAYFDHVIKERVAIQKEVARSAFDEDAYFIAEIIKWRDYAKFLQNINREKEIPESIYDRTTIGNPQTDMTYHNSRWAIEDAWYLSGFGVYYNEHAKDSHLFGVVENDKLPPEIKDTWGMRYVDQKNLMISRDIAALTDDSTVSQFGRVDELLPESLLMHEVYDDWKSFSSMLDAEVTMLQDIMQNGMWRSDYYKLIKRHKEFFEGVRNLSKKYPEEADHLRQIELVLDLLNKLEKKAYS